MIRETLEGFAPLPWTPVLEDGRRWSLTVLCGDGDDLAHRDMNRLEGRLICALLAFAPAAMIYVEQAAAKGGVEAQKLLAAFQHASQTDPRPESVVAARRARR